MSMLLDGEYTLGDWTREMFRNNEIVAFTSFYTLPSSVMHHPTIRTIRAAYSFYNVPSEEVKIVDLLQDTLIVSKNSDHDVFNALDLMENKEFLEELKFGKGDGTLQYYLFNWQCPNISCESRSIIAVVLQ
ncbi:glycylpeptide N-tetradecanoyltransferase 2-like [Brevipalpus obovatus]|uniref:glycylpeptide N-tetradecanoyltransferase 2-like n=1 Tax=Brevipalpus obovatus TaxID=246614 RepID=UPI003D9E88B0